MSTNKQNAINIKFVQIKTFKYIAIFHINPDALNQMS